MKIDIKGKNMDLDEPLKVFVHDKIGGLEQYMGKMGELYAAVEIGKTSRHHYKGPHFYAEANLSVGRNNDPFRAAEEHEDLRSAIVAVAGELQRQIRRFKEKRTDRSRRSVKREV
jgi:putative sigma-54 modulation protein